MSSARVVGRDRPHRGALRVLVCVDYFSPTATGGAERVAAETCGRFVKSGVQVTVVSAVPAGPASRRSSEGIDVRIVAAHDLSRLVGGQFAVGPAVWRVLPAEIDRLAPDVIITHSLHFHSSIAAAFFARRRGVPLVTTVHVAGLDALPLSVRFPASLYERSIGRWILSRSDRVIAVSESAREHAQSLGARPDRVVVIPNGVDVELFHPVEPTVDQVGPQRPLRVVFVGRLIANKGARLALDAFALLKERGCRFSAVVVGDGPLGPSLRDAVRSLGLEGAVTFTGAIVGVVRELRDADVLIRPSMTEGMSLAVLEAMACGLPVVATDVPGNRDLVRDGENGVLVPYGQPEALAGALERLASDAALRDRLGRAARQTALDHSWDDTAEATLDVVEQLAGVPGDSWP